MTQQHKSEDAAVDVSVIMPTFNRAHWLGEAIDSVVAQDLGELRIEIVVADNNSTDDTQAVAAAAAERAATHGVPVRTYLERRKGDAQARNRAVAESRGRWLAFFDDDQFATDRWLVELVRCAERFDVPVVGGPVLLAIDDDQRERLGRICREQLREIDLSTDVREYVGKELPGTGNALVRRSLFDDLGGFSESFPSGGSDSDFFLRARNAGHKLLYNPRSPIRHRVDKNRLTPAYLQWSALASGAEHLARFDLENHGRLGLVVRCVARLGQAGLVNGPLWLLARVRNDEGGALGRRALLSRCEGYTRRTLRELLPSVFPQRAFFASLNMSEGRKVADAAPTAVPPPVTVERRGAVPAE